MNNVINPIYFINEKPVQSEDLGSSITMPIVDFANRPVVRNCSLETYAFMRADYIINNITDLCNTFMIRLLEDNIDRDEIAYIIDFTDTFNMKQYLQSTIGQYMMMKVNYWSEQKGASIDELMYIMYSSTSFILHQFIQFYTMTKLVYRKEGVDLYVTLYKNTYNEEPSETNLQTKYVFCSSILSSILEEDMINIKKCIDKLKQNLFEIN